MKNSKKKKLIILSPKRIEIKKKKKKKEKGIYKIYSFSFKLTNFKYTKTYNIE